MDDDSRWIEQVRARGMGSALAVVLDVLAPLGPLGAQLLWVAQPALGLLGLRETVGGLAGALEEPGGVERLRRLLEDQD